MAEEKKGDELKNLASQYSQVDLKESIPLIGNVIEKLSQLAGKLDVIGDFAEIFKGIQTQVNEVSRLFAGSHNLAKLTQETLRDATPSIMALGGQMDDVAKIQMGVLKGLQTQAVLNTESYKDMFAASVLVSDGTASAGDVAAKMIPMFVNAGYGINNIGKEMTGVLNSAKELGVTAQAVYKGLEDNIAKVQVFNFENGVQGMAKMAANAALLRIDMATSLELADKLFNPESAVEMSAAFQRLGVNVTSLLDPYKLMDMARNDPEKLQEEMGKALKSLTYFDEQSKSVRILPGAQGHLRALSDEMGIAKETLAKWAVSAGDLDRKMREIRFSPTFASDEDRKMIAGMAQLGQTGSEFEGKYIVTLKNERGETEQKLVSELTEADRAAILEANAPAKSAVDMQVEANGLLRQIANNTKARAGVISRALATDPKVVSGIENLAKVNGRLQETINEAIGVNREMTQSDRTGFINQANLNKGMTKVADDFTRIMETLLVGDVGRAGGLTNEAISNITKMLAESASRVPSAYVKSKERYDVEIPLESIKNNLTKLVNEFGIDVDKVIEAIKLKIQPLISAAQPMTAGAGGGLIAQAQAKGFGSPENSTVKVDGSISVNVNPTNLEPFIMGILSKSDIASAIYMSNTRTEKALNDYKGSGENPAKAGNLFAPTYNTA